MGYTAKFRCMGRWSIKEADSPCEVVYRFPFHGVKTWAPILVAARGCGWLTVFVFSGRGHVIFLQYTRQGNEADIDVAIYYTYVRASQQCQGPTSMEPVTMIRSHVYYHNRYPVAGTVYYTRQKIDAFGGRPPQFSILSNNTLSS